MNILKDIGIFFAGLILGGTVNMALVNLGINIIPPPSGFDMSTELGMKAAMNSLSMEHFIFPFLAHALGTLIGAWFVARYNAQRPMSAFGIGIAFLLGAISMAFTIGGPSWFIISDALLAYIPMAWLGYRLGMRKV